MCEILLGRRRWAWRGTYQTLCEEHRNVGGAAGTRQADSKLGPRAAHVVLVCYLQNIKAKPRDQSVHSSGT